MSIDYHINFERREAGRRRLGTFLAVSGLLALTLVPLGQVVLAVGILGGFLAAATAALGARIVESGTVRVGIMALLLGLIGLIELPFGIWFAVAGVWLWSRAFPQLSPARGWLPAGSSSPIL